MGSFHSFWSQTFLLPVPLLTRFRSCCLPSFEVWLDALLHIATIRCHVAGSCSRSISNPRTTTTMASAITMVRSQPQGRNKQKPPPPPPPPKKKPPPPPPPPGKAKPKPPTQSAKRPAPPAPAQPPTKKSRKTTVSIQAPVVLRDVNVFLKKHQVGQGTYGYVVSSA